ncbi:MAG: 5-oxoprolinase subunit PxpB, partial [Clostridia bacterium]|nr:5-oxoprolinase subunit PxpB [Clostridia bacterium]
ARLYEQLSRIVNSLQEADIPTAGEIRVPVLYGGSHGPDLENVAKLHDMTPEEVIRIHTAPVYLNYMLGFLPGFCYLGGLDERIHTPRLTTPRVSIPAGSVGIAGSQTGIYPLTSPGGWQLIGQTPLRLYDPKREKAILVDAGMNMIFYPIDEAEYERIRRENYPEEYGEGGDKA